MKLNQYPSPKGIVILCLLSFASFCSEVKAVAQGVPTKNWDKTFGGSLQDYLYSFQQTSDGGYIFGGSSRSGISGDKSVSSKGLYDFWVIKTDATGSKVWDKVYGGNGSEELKTILQTSDGGYFLCGISNTSTNGDKSQPSRGGNDFWVIKIDASGIKQWDKTYGGVGNDMLRTGQQTNDGGYILAGTSNSNISGEKSDSTKGGLSDFWVVKIDGFGTKQWDKTFGGDDVDGPDVVKQTTDGGYIVAGVSLSGMTGNKNYPSKGESDGWLIKLDANGVKQWERVYGGLDDDNITDLLQTPDGGYILVGSSRSSTGGDKSQNSRGRSDYWLIKTDGIGLKQWDKTYGGNHDDDNPKILQTPDGGYLLAGTSLSGLGSDKSEGSIGDFDFWLVKTSATGVQQWDKVYGGTNSEYLLDFKNTNDGGYILGGRSDSPQGGDKSQSSRGDIDFWVLKVGGLTAGIPNEMKELSLSIFPNPNNGNFKLQVPSLINAPSEIFITDLAGKQVFKQMVENISNEFRLKLPKGLYILQVNSGYQSVSKKFLVQ